MKYLYSFVVLLLLACNNTPPSTIEKPQKTLPRAVVEIHTDYGSMRIELFNETPLHRDNFLKLVEQGFYDSLLIHRVQPNFMIQGGDPDSRGNIPAEQRLGFGNAGERIKQEINPSFIMRQGAICGYHQGVGMQADKSSNASQFMIIHGSEQRAYQLKELSLSTKMNYTAKQIELYELYGGAPQLDGKYTIFGQVTEGLHILNKIVKVPTHRSVDASLPDRPLKDIRMKMEIINDYKDE